jgi:3-hydroxyisobutyrate dehydrogenase
MNSIGFVGLGAMGLPMALRLVAAGYAVRGFDLKAAALDALAASGGSRAESAAAAAQDADALVLMVVNAAQARAVLFDGGALAALKSSAVVILMATCAPADAAGIGEEVEAAGRRFVDAPVSGGVVGATGGTLTIMAAARNDVFAAARSLLAALGDKLFHVGERPGQGAMVKTVNQLLCGVHIAAAAEAFSLAGKAGIDLRILLEILSGSAASSWMLRTAARACSRSEPAVASASTSSSRTLASYSTPAAPGKAALPLAAAAHQMFLAASGLGHGGADDSQVLRAYRALNREPLSRTGEG